MRRMRPVRDEPVMVNVGSTGALEWPRPRMPAPRSVCRGQFTGSSERTESIAADQSARRNGNAYRTLIAPPIGATAIA